LGSRKNACSIGAEIRLFGKFFLVKTYGRNNEFNCSNNLIYFSKDPNDDNIILGIPEDIDPATLPSDAPVRKVKIIQKHGKKSKMLLNK